MNLINLKYGKNFREHLLLQYQLFVKSSEEISSKRMNNNKFYLTLNTALFGIVGYLFYLNKFIIILAFSVAGIIISLLWSEGISSYKELNCAKFKIIHEIEDYLPASPYKKEDEHLKNIYKITKLEKFVPWIFFGSYCLSFIINFLVLFKLF